MAIPNATTFMHGGSELLDSIETLWKQLRAFHVNLSVNFGPHMARSTFAERKQGLLDKTENGQIRIDLARQSPNDQILGYCVTIIDPQGIGEIESIYVIDGARGAGIGDTLMRRATRWLDEQGVKTRCVIVAFENQRVVSLYERFGFKPRLIRMECHNTDNGNA